MEAWITVSFSLPELSQSLNQNTPVSISVPGVDTLLVETLDAIINEVRPYSEHGAKAHSCTQQDDSSFILEWPARIELRFETGRDLACFRHALSFVRFVKGRGSENDFSAVLGTAATIVEFDADGSYLHNLERLFHEARNVPPARTSFNALPVELIAEIFILCVPSVGRLAPTRPWCSCMFVRSGERSPQEPPPFGERFPSPSAHRFWEVIVTVRLKCSRGWRGQSPT